MQSALQQDDLAGFDAKKLTPLRIVTYRLADGAVHEYLYLLDNPVTTKTAVSEIAALSNTTFLVDERDGNFPPGAYKKLFLIDIAGATDVGPSSSVPGTAYDSAHGGLLIGGHSIERFLENLNTADSLAALTGVGIAPSTKSLYLDAGALITSIDSHGRFFGHDKVEGVAALNGGATIVLSNDSDFGIDGVTNSTPPFQLHVKLTPAGVQDDGEFLVIDLVRSDAAVTIDVHDTIPPDTIITSTPPSVSGSDAATFAFAGSDSGSGIAGFECALDAGPFAPCASGDTFEPLASGAHLLAVRAVDRAGNADQTPATFAWTVALFNVARGGFVRDRRTGLYAQQVTVQNTSSSLLSGPIILVVDGLSANAVLSNSSGVTSSQAPLGSPYIVVPGTDSGLAPGASAAVVLQFANPTNAAITYSTRVLNGQITP